MKQLIKLASFVIVLFGLSCKSFAQLDNKTIYIYNRGDKLHQTFYCTDELPNISDIGAELVGHVGKYVRISPQPARTRGYWRKTSYEGVYALDFITFSEKRQGWTERYNTQTWFFYESLNIFTQIPPEEINSKKSEIINDPWKYGHKAVYYRIISEEEKEKKQKNKEDYSRKKAEFLLEVEKNKHLFTQTELENIDNVYDIDSYKRKMSERQKIYNLINQHPQELSPKYYYEVITQYTDLRYAEEIIVDQINQIKNKNRIVGEWKSKKGRGNECIISSIGDQFFLTLKYKRDVIYEGWIPEKKGAKTNGRRRDDRRRDDNSQVFWKVNADTIIINVSVIHKESSSSRNTGSYWYGNSGHTVEIEYRFTFENGGFVLYVLKDRKEIDRIPFIKEKSW